MPERIPQSATLRVPIYATLAGAPVTGKTIAITVSKNGAAFANPSGGATNAVEIASGWYYVDLSATDTGTLGPLLVRGTSAGMDDVALSYDVVSATNAGLSNLDAAVSTRLATAGYTAPDNSDIAAIKTKTDQLVFASSRVNANANWTSAPVVIRSGESIASAQISPS